MPYLKKEKCIIWDGSKYLENLTNVVNLLEELAIPYKSSVEMKKNQTNYSFWTWKIEKDWPIEEVI